MVSGYVSAFEKDPAKFVDSLAPRFGGSPPLMLVDRLQFSA
jgi:hypothetical protein